MKFKEVKRQLINLSKLLQSQLMKLCLLANIKRLITTVTIQYRICE